MKVTKYQKFWFKTITDLYIIKIVGMMEKKYQNPKFFDQKDTEELVATYTYGRGLTPLTTTPRRPEVMNQQMNQQRMNQNAPIGGGPMGNMPGK